MVLSMMIHLDIMLTTLLLPTEKIPCPIIKVAPVPERGYVKGRWDDDFDECDQTTCWSEWG
jgi:hypothetical protein